MRDRLDIVLNELADRVAARVAEHLSGPTRENPAASDLALLNVQEVARELRVSVRTVRRLLNSHVMPCVRVGRKRLIRREDLTRYVTEHAGGGAIAALRAQLAVRRR